MILFCYERVPTTKKIELYIFTIFCILVFNLLRITFNSQIKNISLVWQCYLRKYQSDKTVAWYTNSMGEHKFYLYSFLLSLWETNHGKTYVELYSLWWRLFLMHGFHSCNLFILQGPTLVSFWWPHCILQVSCLLILNTVPSNICLTGDLYQERGSRQMIILMIII